MNTDFRAGFYNYVAKPQLLIAAVILPIFATTDRTVITDT